MKNIRNYILISILAFMPGLAGAYDNAAFHCDSDTTVINRMLADPQLAGMSKNKQLAHFAKQLVGAQSNVRDEILRSDSVRYTIDIHTFNPLSLISTCVALVKAYETSSKPNWRDFADKYEDVMYKNGKASDFVSRFLYASDWIADNIFRGNVADATQIMEGLNIRKKEKSIDYISRHKDSFKAFANQANLDRIKMLEMGFRNHQIIYITNGDLTNTSRYKRLAQDGDIVFLLAPDYNLDCREMGILYHDGDNLMMIQVSPEEDKVVAESLPFDRFVKRNIKRIQGARIIRIK